MVPAGVQWVWQEGPDVRVQGGVEGVWGMARSRAMASRDLRV
jgi:hypothetical protein